VATSRTACWLATQVGLARFRTAVDVGPNHDDSPLVEKASGGRLRLGLRRLDLGILVEGRHEDRRDVGIGALELRPWE
jgi:hypothetical protein